MPITSKRTLRVRMTTPPTKSPGLSGWTFILLCAGIGLVACCILIPQTDENRRRFAETEKLRTDLDHLKRQVQANDEFLKRIDTDPAIAERLAQRQMKYIRKGTNVLDLSEPDAPSSPFLLTVMPDSAPAPQMQPLGGRLAKICRDTRSRIYMMGCGLLLLAAGLVLGATPPRR